MKKIFLIVLTILTASLFASFSKPVKTETIRGYVKIFSNEPFSFPGIETEDGKKYTIIADEKVREEMYMIQGYLVDFTGRISTENKLNKQQDQKLSNGYFELDSWKVYK